MPIAWRPKGRLKFSMSEDEKKKKEIEPIFTEGL